MSIDIDIHPWTEWRRIYERDGISIIQVYARNWVVKYAHSRAAITKEITFLRGITEGDAAIRNMIELPADPTHRFGENWYAMRKYTNSAHACCDEVRGQWKTIAIDVLNFLEDLHRGHRLAHLDITLRNILYDRETGHFVVSDYELLEEVSTEAAITEDNDDHLWYYIGTGAELSQPIESWRMDLTMLGYALAELTWCDARPSFAPLCQTRRCDSNMGICDYDIIARRNAEMKGCPQGVRAYLDRVAELVDWRAAEPPSPATYDELRAVFTQRNQTTVSDEGGSGSPPASPSSS